MNNKSDTYTDDMILIKGKFVSTISKFDNVNIDMNYLRLFWVQNIGFSHCIYQTHIVHKYGSYLAEVRGTKTQISLYTNQNAEIVLHSNKINLIKSIFQGFVDFFRFREITAKIKIS